MDLIVDDCHRIVPIVPRSNAIRMLGHQFFQLRLLERDYGVKLYRRNGKGIELTAAGRLFLSRVAPILEVEIAVSTRCPHHAELAWEPFRRERMVLFVSRKHPLARKNKVTSSDVQTFPLVIRYLKGAPGTTVRLLNELSAQGLKFKIGMRCEAPYAIKEAVKKNAGIGVVFEDVVKREVERGEFKILKGHGLKLESDTYILYRADKPLSALAQEFLTLLRKACAARQGTDVPATFDSSLVHNVSNVNSDAARSLNWEPLL